MFAIYESNGLHQTKLVEFATFMAAYTYVKKQEPISLEQDFDYPGCADAYMKDGRILTIEPANRRA